MTSLRSYRKTIAIGPEMDRPTWTWIGFDLARELSKYYDIKVFKNHRVTPCEALIVIKEPLSLYALDLFNLPNIIYFPCDRYRCIEEIEQDPFLKRCSYVVCHSKHLADTIKSFHLHVSLVNHNGKYILPRMNSYKKDGFVIWTGFSLYLPYLRQWLSEYPLENQLVILTDWPGEEYVPGKATQLKWTPRLQFEMMSSAKAAMDIKGDDFNQLNRPPEKLQTFIASGIPSACNPGPIRTYLKDCGFDLPVPDSADRWFSKEYYDETILFGKRLREEMSLENVGREVKKILDSLL